MTDFTVRAEPNKKRAEPNENLFSKRKRVLLLQQTGFITSEELCIS